MANPMPGLEARRALVGLRWSRRCPDNGRLRRTAAVANAALSRRFVNATWRSSNPDTKRTPFLTLRASEPPVPASTPPAPRVTGGNLPPELHPHGGRIGCRRRDAQGQGERRGAAGPGGARRPLSAGGALRLGRPDPAPSSSARIPGPEHHFLINPYGLLFEEITALSLVKKIDLEGNILQRRPISSIRRVSPSTRRSTPREDAHFVRDAPALTTGWWCRAGRGRR